MEELCEEFFGRGAQEGGVRGEVELGLRGQVGGSVVGFEEDLAGVVGGFEGAEELFRGWCLPDFDAAKVSHDAWGDVLCGHVTVESGRRGDLGDVVSVVGDIQRSLQE